MRRAATVAAAGLLLAVACDGEVGPGEERERTDRDFARVAMGILADAAHAELAYHEREGRFTDDPEAADLPTEGVDTPEADPTTCGGGQVLVLAETTPHGASYSLKLDATSDQVQASHYAEIVPCDPSPGPDRWSNGCAFTPSGLSCPEVEA